MLSLDATFLDHIQGDVLNLAVCWVVQKNGSPTEYIRGTSHDHDITITTGPYAGTYRSETAIMSADIAKQSDGSVNNTEVEGGLQVDVDVPDITVSDIESGILDQARAVLFLVNWSSPDDDQRVLLAGTLGEFYRDDHGRYRSEVRGLTQKLSQVTTQTYSERCNVKTFGDARCGLDLSILQITGTVDSVTDRRRFTAVLDSGPNPVDDVYYGNGLVRFTSGANTGFAREVRAHTPVGVSNDIDILMWEEFPEDVSPSPGDTFVLTPGCDRLWSTCRYTFDNLVNFRGYGILAPGRQNTIRDPKAAKGEQLVSFPTQTEHDNQRAEQAAAFLVVMGL